MLVEATPTGEAERRRRADEGEVHAPSMGRSWAGRGGEGEEVEASHGLRAGMDGNRRRRDDADGSSSDMELERWARSRQADVNRRKIGLLGKSSGVTIIQTSDAIDDWDEPLAALEFAQEQAFDVSSCCTHGLPAGLPLQQLQSCAKTPSPSLSPRVWSGHASPATGSEEIDDVPPGRDSAQEFLSNIDGELRRLLRAPPGAMLNLPPLAPTFRALLDIASARYHMNVADAHSSGRGEVNINATAETWSMEDLSTPGKSLTHCPGLRIWPTCDLTPYAAHPSLDVDQLTTYSCHPLDRTHSSNPFPDFPSAMAPATPQAASSGGVSFTARAQEFAPAADFRPTALAESCLSLQSQSALSVEAAVFEPGATSIAGSERHLPSGGGVCLLDERACVARRYGANFDAISNVAPDANGEKFSIDMQDGWLNHYPSAESCDRADYAAGDPVYEHSRFPVAAAEFVASAGVGFKARGQVSLSPSAHEFTPTIRPGASPSNETQLLCATYHQGHGIGQRSGVESGLSSSAPDFIPMSALPADHTIQTTSTLSSAAAEFSPAAGIFFSQGQLSADAAEFKPMAVARTVGPPPGSFVTLPSHSPGKMQFQDPPGCAPRLAAASEAALHHLDGTDLTSPEDSPPRGEPSSLDGRTAVPAPPGYTAPMCMPGRRSAARLGRCLDQRPSHQDAQPPTWDADILIQSGFEPRAAQNAASRQDDADSGCGSSGALRAGVGNHGCDQDGWGQGDWERKSWQQNKHNSWAEDDRNRWRSEDWKMEDLPWEHEGWKGARERERGLEWLASTRSWQQGGNGWQESSWQREGRAGVGSDRPGKPPMRRDVSSESSDSDSVSGSESSQNVRGQHAPHLPEKPYLERRMLKEAPSRMQREERLPNSSHKRGLEQDVKVQHAQPDSVSASTGAVDAHGEPQTLAKPVSTIDKSAFHRIALGHLLGKREPRSHGN